MAVRSGRLKEEQLRLALEEQKAGVQRGRKRPRRLGAILAERRFLTDGEVRSLLEEQEARLLAEEARHRADGLLGRILVDAGFAKAAHVEEGLAAQAAAIGRGDPEPPLLGAYLVRKGYASAADVDQALEIQRSSALVCTSCRAPAPLDAEKCASCGGALESPAPKEAGPPPTPAPAPPAEVLPRLGRYEILRQIGRGGMGEVFEARDASLERLVAVKILRLRAAWKGSGEDDVRRFRREAELAARLPKHPNIVQVYETGSEGNVHFIAMELVQGTTLNEWRKTGPSLRRQVQVLRDVALAVQHAHDHEVLHRDLKPKNILVNPDGVPFVVDFGIARPMRDDPSVSGVVAGTASYMSPEQAKPGTTLDGRADVYSLGTILYEMLAGRSPFEGQSKEEIVRALRSGSVPPPGGFSRSRPFSSVDAAIEKICLQAMAHDRDKRTPSAKALANALDVWLKSRERAPGDKTRAIPRLKGCRTLFLAAAGAALAAALLIGLTLGRGG
jgi:serine/threonine-protein kinase